MRLSLMSIFINLMLLVAVLGQRRNAPQRQSARKQPARPPRPPKTLEMQSEPSVSSPTDTVQSAESEKEAEVTLPDSATNLEIGNSEGNQVFDQADIALDDKPLNDTSSENVDKFNPNVQTDGENFSQGGEQLPSEMTDQMLLEPAIDSGGTEEVPEVLMTSEIDLDELSLPLDDSQQDGHESELPLDQLENDKRDHENQNELLLVDSQQDDRLNEPSEDINPNSLSEVEPPNDLAQDEQHVDSLLDSVTEDLTEDQSVNQMPPESVEVNEFADDGTVGSVDDVRETEQEVSPDAIVPDINNDNSEEDYVEEKSLRDDNSYVLILTSIAASSVIIFFSFYSRVLNNNSKRSEFARLFKKQEALSVVTKTQMTQPDGINSEIKNQLNNVGRSLNFFLSDFSGMCQDRLQRHLRTEQFDREMINNFQVLGNYIQTHHIDQQYDLGQEPFQ